MNGHNRRRATRSAAPSSWRGRDSCRRPRTLSRDLCGAGRGRFDAVNQQAGPDRRKRVQICRTMRTDGGDGARTKGSVATDTQGRSPLQSASSAILFWRRARVGARRRDQRRAAGQRNHGDGPASPAQAPCDARPATGMVLQGGLPARFGLSTRLCLGEFQTPPRPRGHGTRHMAVSSRARVRARAPAVVTGSVPKNPEGGDNEEVRGAGPRRNHAE